jgi:hypothetical protein
MNNLKNLKYLIAVFAICSIFLSCEEADSGKEYGFALVYMPQSTMLSGGYNNDYPVPGGFDRFPNYTYDSVSQSIKVILGVYRSGLQKLEEFTVEVYSDVDTTNQIISDSVIANAALLPTDVFSFPSTATVKSGSRETIFYLTIDGAKLNNDYPSLAGQTLLVTIGIRKPTKYSLNEKLSKTVILINSGVFMTMP